MTNVYWCLVIGLLFLLESLCCSKMPPVSFEDENKSLHLACCSKGTGRPGKVKASSDTNILSCVHAPGFFSPSVSDVFVPEQACWLVLLWLFCTIPNQTWILQSKISATSVSSKSFPVVFDAFLVLYLRVLLFLFLLWSNLPQPFCEGTQKGREMHATLAQSRTS